MALRIFKKIGWRYALGELVLIFLGITMAIWFNNWNEARKEVSVEIKSLEELRDALQQDLQDIELNIHGFDGRVKGYKRLLKHMEQQLPLSDSLLRAIPYIRGFTFLVSNDGPYETLKSRGLETVTNDSLRLQIATYYDLDYDKLLTNESEHRRHYANYMKPKLMEHFLLKDYQMQPIDYNALIQDFDFRQILYWASATDEYLLHFYQHLNREGNRLLANIKTEIERLE
ncbi:DUF6090 family protein [Flavilitoribacter nigricans]|uniref:Uncharacterized protein n=1 Tax=Flavilitoribacter nigricans (strain ATCC 23147 / DSM 23189 / NBRC 102662 / NCIMB 1420 / SS-2) TaxID=1122177 RepID=A0A2D0N8F5_FLAN2|nr:DUF6090 family protein [Flavilitoribacter nigricans]PHN04670.1 hypothetical protein CRP01_19315 [Flavilitoribacter nigricans DSM 23189 = NBRC 102662]